MFHHGCIYEQYFFISFVIMFVAIICLGSFCVYLFLDFSKPVDNRIKKHLDKIKDETQKIRKIEEKGNVVSISRRNEVWKHKIKCDSSV